MTTDQILDEGRKIWGDKKLNLSQIIVRLGKVFGDICRWERNYKKDISIHTELELKKELGNIIVSTTRWCDDLGYDPNECVEIALSRQKAGRQELNKAD